MMIGTCLRCLLFFSLAISYKTVQATIPSIAETPQGWNCEPLSDDFQVRWKVDGEDLALELVGFVDEQVYMGFGVSGSETSTNMVGADAVVADVFNGEFRARDFYISARAPCDNAIGVCPDVASGAFTNDVSNISGESDSGITLVRFKRPLKSTDLWEEKEGQAVDQAISVEPGISTFVVWALGPVDPDTGLPLFHSIDFPGDDVSIEFGRDVENKCDPLVGEPPSTPPDVENPTEPPTLEVDCSNLRDSPIALAEGLTLNAVIDPVEEILTAELIYDGVGWVAMGFTSGDAVMVGSEAVIALPARQNSQTNPGKYELNAQRVSGVELMPQNQQTLVNSAVVQTNGQTILSFNKILNETNEHPISATESNTFLWAYGAENKLAQHAERGGFAWNPRQCRVLVNGVVQNPDEVGKPQTAIPQTEIPKTDTPQEVIVPAIAETPQGYNCEPLSDELQVRWKVNGDQLAIELVGFIDEGVYMGFGISGSETSTNMVGADAVIADIFNGEFRARDFYINARDKCSNGDGVCPDDTNGAFTDDSSTVSGEENSGLTLVRYTRALTPANVGENAGGQPVDRSISVVPGVSTFIVWALGPVDQNTGLPLFHSIDFPGDDVSIEFGREVENKCDPLVVEDATLPPTQPPAIENPTEPPAVEVDCSNLRDSPITLAEGLTLNAVIDPVEEILTAELIYDGVGWVAMGFTSGDAVMVGSEAVIALPADPISQTNPGKYDLNDKAVSGVQLMPDSQQTLVNSTIVQTNAQTILFLNKFLNEPNEHPISPTQANTFLWAHGEDNELAQHVQRGGFSWNPRQCRVLVDGVVQNPDQVGTPQTEIPETEIPQTDSPQEIPVPTIAETPDGYNCEPLNEDFQVRWQVDGDQLAIELVGLIDEEVYMGFGVSGSDTSTNMVGADAVIADVFNGAFRARDFYMNSRGPCNNGNGVCPENTSGALTDDTSNVSGEEDSGITLIRFTRPLTPTNVGETVGGQPVDRIISVDDGVSTFIVWALGPVDSGTGLPQFHSIDYPREDVSIEFGRDVENRCNPLVGGATEPPIEPPELQPFLLPPIKGTTDFTARIGPPGGDRGYSGITGREPFNVAWYINDLLVPVIEMRRGTTYTFRVNGGDDPQAPGSFHPMYLTTSIAGGYAQLTPQERAEETVFAGIEIIEQNDDGVQEFNALSAGPLCLYSVTDKTEAALSGSYGEFFSSLDTSCAADTTVSDTAAVLEFTPDENTPDLLYYQCVTHRNLGWEIRVLDDVSGFQVDCSNLGESPQVLADGLTLNAVIDPVENVLIAELTYEGEAWLAMGFTAGSGVMVGSEAVIGLPGEAQGLTNPGKYDLNARDVSGVNLMPDEKQTLTNASVVQEDGQTILKFTKLLEEPNEHPISTTESNTFLWAYGSGNNLAVHAARAGFEFLPAECRVFADGVLQNEDRAGAPDAAAGGGGNTSNLWVAHGVSASTAWGILVPLAVGSSLIRNVLERIGMPKGAWFSVHRALNMIAFFLTVAAFSIAVYIFNKAERDHFTGKTHFTLGLVIFILTFFQALGGILRPHLPAPVEVAVKDEELNQIVTTKMTPKKSVSRRSWEILHRLVGVGLLGMAWWQVQNGFGLFSILFNTNDIKGIFWIIVGGICGCFVLLFVHQQCMLKKKSKH